MAKVPWVLAVALAIACAIVSHKHSLLQRRAHELERLVSSLERQTNDLHGAFLSLQATDRLAGLRIAMLGSLEPGAKAQAVCIWDNEKQTGVFVAHHLRRLPADSDYQLWILDSKYKAPVNAGIFQPDAEGKLRMPFKADKPIGRPDTFVVTVEKKGGAAAPSLKDLVLIGS